MLYNFSAYCLGAHTCLTVWEIWQSDPSESSSRGGMPPDEGEVPECLGPGNFHYVMFFYASRAQQTSQTLQTCMRSWYTTVSHRALHLLRGIIRNHKSATAHTHTHIYIYIYIYFCISVSLSLSIYIYIYIHM